MHKFVFLGWLAQEKDSLLFYRLQSFKYDVVFFG